MLLWTVIVCWHCIKLCWQRLLSNLICFRYYRSNLVCNNFVHTLMMEMYLRTLCNMWHVCWIMYDLGCLWIIYRDPSWYSMDYRVYMCSSMTVRPLAGCHCTCTLINWSVLRQLALEQGSMLIVTCVFKTKVFVFQNPSLATNSYINRYLKSKVYQWSLSLCPS